MKEVKLNFAKLASSANKFISVVDHLAVAVSAILTYCLFRTPRAESIHSAAQKGETEKIKLLIQQGVDVNARDYEGNTPLHLAALRGDKDAVELLIEKKAYVHAKTKTGETALHRAAHSGSTEIIDLLIANKADVNDRDYAGNTPFHYAVASRKNNAVKLLIAKKADVYAQTKKGVTPFNMALSGYSYIDAQPEQEELIEILIKHMANINDVNKTDLESGHILPEANLCPADSIENIQEVGKCALNDPPSQ